MKRRVKSVEDLGLRIQDLGFSAQGLGYGRPANESAGEVGVLRVALGEVLGVWVAVLVTRTYYMLIISYYYMLIIRYYYTLVVSYHYRLINSCLLSSCLGYL